VDHRRSGCLETTPEGDSDLRKTELELQKIELDLRRIAVVRPDISATSFRLPDGPG
jgi:hypothetical protein